METALKLLGLILRDGRGIRAVARETGLSGTTINKYLKDDDPPQYRRAHERAGLKLSAVFESRLGALFKHDLQLRRRNRRTAKNMSYWAVSSTRFMWPVSVCATAASLSSWPV